MGGHGYAVVTAVDGAVIRRASSVRPADRVDIRLAAGRLAAAVISVHPADGRADGWDEDRDEP